MKRIISIAAVITAFAFFSVSFVSAEEGTEIEGKKINKGAVGNSTAGNDAEIKKAEAKVTKTKAALDKADKQVSDADAQIKAGNDLTNEGKSEFKQVTVDESKMMKEYDNELSPLEKQSKSRDKDDVAQAKIEIKALTKKYLAATKVIETRYKVADKKIASGKSDITKSTKEKETASKDQVKSKKNYDDAVANLNKLKAAKK